MNKWTALAPCAVATAAVGIFAIPSGATREATAAPAVADRLVFSAYVTASLRFIYTANSDGSDRRQVTNDGQAHDPAWSPNGRTIAYAGRDAIFIENARGVGKQRLPLTGHGTDPRWSPDGTRIVYTDEYDVIAIVDTIGGRPRQINPPRGATEPDWSPDGKRIAFATNARAGSLAIYVMNIDGSAVRKITRPPPGAQDRGVRWSPDGKRLLFYRWGNRDASRVFTVSPRGGPVKLLFTAEVFGLSWSPDGRQVAYANGQIRIFDLASRRHRLFRVEPCMSNGICHDVDW
jgi:Tol biopolymer transport system component